MARVYMSKSKSDAPNEGAAQVTSQKKENLHPAPSFIWMLIPIALLGLLTFLSR